MCEKKLQTNMKTTKINHTYVDDLLWKSTEMKMAEVTTPIFNISSSLLFIFVTGLVLCIRLPPPINWPPQYTCNWNIVESGVKHHNSNPDIYITVSDILES